MFSGYSASSANALGEEPATSVNKHISDIMTHIMRYAGRFVLVLIPDVPPS
jgi:hypothetical protein